MITGLISILFKNFFSFPFLTHIFNSFYKRDLCTALRLNEKGFFSMYSILCGFWYLNLINLLWPWNQTFPLQYDLILFDSRYKLRSSPWFLEMLNFCFIKIQNDCMKILFCKKFFPSFGIPRSLLKLLGAVTLH